MTDERVATREKKIQAFFARLWALEEAAVYESTCVSWDGWMFNVRDEVCPVELPHGDNKNGTYVQSRQVGSSTR